MEIFLEFEIEVGCGEDKFLEELWGTSKLNSNKADDAFTIFSFTNMGFFTTVKLAMQAYRTAEWDPALSQYLKVSQKLPTLVCHYIWTENTYTPAKLCSKIASMNR